MYIYLNLSTMSIITVKVLRTISKIVLLIVGIGIIGYGGLMVYKSVVNKPQKVRITNVTDSAATITWVTDNPVRGVVYYKDEGTFLPGPLGLLGSKLAYDDRDFARAQDECVKAFNENAKNTKDANFTVDGSSFDCENIPVEKLGAYYTHSVTIKNLNESGTYFFVVGNGIWSWSVDGVDKTLSANDLPVTNSFNFKTSKLLEDIPTPNIAYGTVYASVKGEEGYLSESLSKDSLVFAYLTTNGVNSQTISAVTNIDGGWVLDKSNFRNIDGNLMTDLSNSSMVVCSQYEDVEPKVCMEVKEDLDSDTDVDLLGNIVDDLSPYEKNQILKKWDELIGGVYAEDTGCVPAGVDGCHGVDSKCYEKCPIEGTNEFEYIEIGTVGEGSCELPYSCGCDSNACEGRCTSGEEEKRTCDEKGEYRAWSSWGGGQCDDIKSCSSKGIDECDANSDCGDNEVCNNGKCSSKGIDECDANSDCGDNEVCNNGKCSSKGIGECDANSDCGDNEVCNNGNCEAKNSVPTPTPEPTAPEKCTITYSYTEIHSPNRCIPNTKAACTLKCGENSQVLSVNGCKKLGVKECILENDSETVGGNTITVAPVNIEDLSLNGLKLLIGKEPKVRDAVIIKMENLITLLNSWECESTWSVNVPLKQAKSFCSVLNGTWDTKITKMCKTAKSEFEVGCSYAPVESATSGVVSKAYAQDSASDGYTLYLPEYGMYSFELGDYELTKGTVKGATYYIFYIETNSKKGFQMPKDPENPTEKEDIMLKSSSASITYEKVSSAQSYTLVKGINLVSFNFIPVSTDLGPLTAKGVIDEASNNGVTIQYISSFDGGRWSKGYTCKNEKCSGNDFNIIPGKGYLVFATKGGEMTIPGYNLKTSVPVNLSSGWNLVGIHGYTTAYTARTLIDSMSKIDGVTANNVTWWPTSKGMYEGLQVTGEQQYGFDFPISPTNGYFVRISSFKPEDDKCKSLLWNEGGTLNGTCGVIK